MEAFSRKKRTVSETTCGPASMLPATDMSSPIQWPHHGTHSAPVWAAKLAVGTHDMELAMLAAGVEA